MRRSQRKRIEKLESSNQQPTAPPAVERVIYDSREQVEYPERFKKVFVREDSTRKIFELERK